MTVLPRANIEVEVTFLPPEHGGRHRAVSSGYRPQFYYGGEDWDATYLFPEGIPVHPGETVTAEVIFLSPQFHQDRVFPGMPFLVREGNRVIGYGRILRLLG